MSAPSAAAVGMQAYRAPSLFQPHRARQALRDAHEGKIPPMIGTFLSVPSVALVRVIAPFGFDMAWIDMEHSACNVETMTSMVHAVSFMSEGKTIPLVRIPNHDHGAIGHALDAGASIILPQVNTVEQAKHIVSAARYGAKNRGSRSVPPFRLLPGLTDTPFDPSRSIHDNLNDQAAIIIQIESLEGINNLDAILTECPEIDAVFLGTLDCRVSMGIGPGSLMGEEPEWLEALATYEAALDKHDKPRSGIVLGPEMRHLHKGKALMFVSTDVRALTGMMGELAEARSIFPKLQSKKDEVSETA